MDVDLVKFLTHRVWNTHTKAMFCTDTNQREYSTKVYRIQAASDIMHELPGFDCAPQVPLFLF